MSQFHEGHDFILFNCTECKTGDQDRDREDVKCNDKRIRSTSESLCDK